MSLDRVINILVTITLIEMMVLVGLRVTFTELAQTAKKPRLVARAAMANYLVSGRDHRPAQLFDVGPMVAAGFSFSRFPERLRPAVCGNRARERTSQSV